MQVLTVGAPNERVHFRQPRLPPIRLAHGLRPTPRPIARWNGYQAQSDRILTPRNENEGITEGVVSNSWTFAIRGCASVFSAGPPGLLWSDCPR